MEATEVIFRFQEHIQTIEPVLREHIKEAEQQRRLSKEVIDQLIEKQFFRIWKPRAFGGLEMDPVSAMQIFEELARIDSATGWNVQLTAGIDVIIQWFGEEALNEVFNSGSEIIFAASWNPPGQAIAVDGGYRVSGTWNIASGCQYANWFFLNTTLVQDGEMRILPNGDPYLMFIVIPAGQGQIIEAWDTMGMCGTGSHDIAVNDVFIPSYRTTAMAPIQGPPSEAYQGPLYRNSVWYAITAIATTALGCARASIDYFKEMAKSKVPRYTVSTLKDHADVHRKLAETEAILGAGRAYFYESIRESWEAAQDPRYRIKMEGRIKLQLAASYAIESASRAVRIIHEVSGLSAVREKNSLEKYFRDIHTITQHAFTAPARYKDVGKLMLSLEPEWGFFHF